MGTKMTIVLDIEYGILMWTLRTRYMAVQWSRWQSMMQ